MMNQFELKILRSLYSKSMVLNTRMPIHKDSTYLYQAACRLLHWGLVKIEETDNANIIDVIPARDDQYYKGKET